MNHFHFRSRAGRLLLLAGCLAIAAPTDSRAAFTTLNLGPLSLPYGYESYAFDQGGDGRLYFGSQGALFQQAAFGGTALNSLQTGGQAFDPSSLKIYTDTLGAIGGYGPIYVFNPTSASNTVTAISGVNLQSYALNFRNASSLYVGGANGSQMNSSAPPFAQPKHAISYVTLDGLTKKTLIDNISEYSGDFTTDTAGNLIVTNNDTGAVARFPKALIDQVIDGTHAVLQFADGTALGTLDDTSSIAIDSLGRIYATGYLHSGISFLDTTTGARGSLTPAGANKNYQVATFTRLGQEYLSFFDTPTTANNTPISYGYDLVSNIPEPASWLLLTGGVIILAYRRRRHESLV